MARDLRTVSIVTTGECCEVARLQRGHRRSVGDIPQSLPLPGCNMRDGCRCRYEIHAERLKDTTLRPGDADPFQAQERQGGAWRIPQASAPPSDEPVSRSTSAAAPGNLASSDDRSPSSKRVNSNAGATPQPTRA